MPYLKSPATLYSLAVRQLASYLIKKYDTCSHVINEESGPLDDLPAVFVEDLFVHAFCASKSGRKWENGLKVFLTPKIRWACIKWDKELVQLVQKKCKNVKCLCIQTMGDNRIPVEALIALKRKYPIVDVNCDFLLQHPVYMDEKLKYLAMSLQGEISSVLSKNYSSIRDQWMQELRVDELLLSVSDICLILNNCPHLQVFCHGDVAKALHKIYEEYSSCTWYRQLPQYELVNILINLAFETDIALPNSIVKEVVSLCPRLKSIEMFLKEMTPPSILNSLLELEEIQNLSVYHSFPIGLFYNHFFQEGIVPILKQHGTSIKILNLEAVSVVDVGMIIHLCPNIEWLGLTENVYGPTKCLTDYAPLENLKFLYLTGTKSEEEVFPSAWYKALLSSPQLQEVLLGYIGVNSEVLKSIIQDNAFQHMKLLSLCSCEGLTHEHVLLLLSLENPLRYLGVIDCDQITKSDVDSIMYFVNRENLDICATIRAQTPFFYVLPRQQLAHR